MKVVMIGTGYVGLVTGTCLSDAGNDVTCIDVNAAKIAQLNQGRVPIYEPGLEELIRRNVTAGRLRFTTDPAAAVPAADLVFIAVGTPQGEDGSADLSYVFSAAASLSPLLARHAIVVIKSTVPVGTNRAVAERLQRLTGRTVEVASNPEFLKEGCAIEDFTRPDRVVVGVASQRAGDLLHELYVPFLRHNQPFLRMNWESAEMTKYVANCFLATKISFINEMANLCERVGADIDEVRQGIGHDQRIGFSFLYPGAGYGGSCFPKDVRALVNTAGAHGFDARMLKSVDAVNDRQKHVLGDKLREHLGDLHGRRIAVWGLAFKPRTDDIREAPALVLIDELLAAGADVHAHDPEAMPNVRRELGNRITCHDDPYEALHGADALVLCTEWADYRDPDLSRIRRTMDVPLVIDGRNLWSSAAFIESGIAYQGIGRRI